MAAESDILKIVKEDILRIMGEENEEKISIESIKSEINASDPFISKAVEELEKEILIKHHNNFISLTKKGEEDAKDLLKRHLVIEDYFKKTKNKKDAHKIADILEHYVSKEVINNVKKLSTFKGEGLPLREFEINTEGVITDIVFSDYGIFERIVSMGIFSGEKIMLTNKIKNCVVAKVKNKKFALDKDIAKEIKVVRDEKA
jgi:Mn-dependent DtxR family transcriptional regulator